MAVPPAISGKSEGWPPSSRTSEAPSPQAVVHVPHFGPRAPPENSPRTEVDEAELPIPSHLRSPQHRRPLVARRWHVLCHPQRANESKSPSLVGSRSRKMSVIRILVADADPVARLGLEAILTQER